MLKSRKGSVLDILYYGMATVVLGIVIVLMFTLLSMYRDVIDDTDMPGINKTIMIEYTDKGLTTMTVWNSIFIFIMIGIGVASIISSFLVQANPAYFIFFFLIGIVSVFLAAQFTNIWYEFATTPLFAPYANSFPIIHTILVNLPSIMLIFSVVNAVVLYTRGQYG